MSEKDGTPSGEAGAQGRGAPPRQVETEVYITPEGRVLITDLTPDLLALAEALAPNDPLIRRLRRLLLEHSVPDP